MTAPEATATATPEPVIHLMQQPRQLIVGGGSRARVGAIAGELGITSALIVTDSFFAEQPLCDEIDALLGAAGIATARFAGPLQEPESAQLDAGVEAAHAAGANGLIALGGGSPIDSAKAIAVLARHGGQMRDYRVPREVALPRMPVIAIPTTAGTGSEATRFTVVTDSGTGEKMLCRGSAFLPDAAIVDYETTLTMPARLIADTGIDAYTHALEAWVSRLATPWSDLLAESAMRLIAGALERACEAPDDLVAREAMMRAATLAGLAFSNASVALVHGMSRPIGGLFHVPHGLSNAMLLPAVTEFSIPGAVERYARAARISGWADPGADDNEAAQALIGALARLNERLKVPGPGTWGISREAWFEAIPTMARMARDSGSPANNPRVPTLPDMESLYARVWGN